MNLLAQSQDMANGSDGLSMGVILIIALVGSTGLTVLVWKLGIIRGMVNVQNQRQARRDSAFEEFENHPERYTDQQKNLMKMVGRKRLYTYYWGTGKSATFSFVGALWLISFTAILFGLVMYT